MTAAPVLTLVCTHRQDPGRPAWPLTYFDDWIWTPAPRNRGPSGSPVPNTATEWTCQVCGRKFRLGARRFRALMEAGTRGELPAVIDLSMR